MSRAVSHPVLLAGLWMSGAITSFSLMAVAGRAVLTELDTFETMLYRSAVGLVIVLSGGALLGTLGQIRRRALGLHAIRNLFHFTGQNLWFFALTMIPLAQVFALEFTSPLWVTLLAPVLLRERLTGMRALSVLIGFAGILVVARPGFNEVNAGVLTAALSAICFAVSILVTKRLTRSETVTCILFWLTVTQLVYGLISTGYDGHITLPSAATWPWLGVIGACGIVAHLCLAQALRLAPATVVVPFDFIRLPVIAMVGVAFYGEALDPFVLLGAAIIFAANYLNICSEIRK